MKTKKMILTGAAAFVAAAAFGAMPVNAAENTEMPNGTAVTYTNNQSIEGDSGVWGVVVPTAYNFKDDALTQKGKVELVGINGYSLADFSDTLEVKVQAKSANNYKVKDTATTANEIAYTVQYGSDPAISANGAADGFVDATKLTKAAPSVETSAILANKGTVKGSYSDKITYKVSHIGEELK